MAERKLTAKQKLFVAEYLADPSATRAAIRAGYSPRTARVIGYVNLQKPVIQAAIIKAQAPRLRRLDMAAEDVLIELARIAGANVLDYMRIDADGAPIVDFAGLDRESAAAISEITVEEVGQGRGVEKREVRRIKFRLHDKLAALDKLAKHFGLLRERMSLENPDGSSLQPRHDPRQVARAVIAILERAAPSAGESDDPDKGGLDGGAPG